jgi:hypothetical protein
MNDQQSPTYAFYDIESTWSMSTSPSIQRETAADS